MRDDPPSLRLRRDRRMRAEGGRSHAQGEIKLRIQSVRAGVKTASFAILAVAMLAITASLHAQRTKPIVEATPIEVPIPKGAVHIVAKLGDKDLSQVFTYFPYPPTPSDARNRILPLVRSGVYRIEVDPQGAVTAVTILKSLGRSMDFAAMKTFTGWKGKPGPLRVVDVTFTFWASGRSGGRPR